MHTQCHPESCIRGGLSDPAISLRASRIGSMTLRHYWHTNRQPSHSSATPVPQRIETCLHVLDLDAVKALSQGCRCGLQPNTVDACSGSSTGSSVSEMLVPENLPSDMI